MIIIIIGCLHEYSKLIGNWNKEQRESLSGDTGTGGFPPPGSCQTQCDASGTVIKVVAGHQRLVRSEATTRRMNVL